MAVARITSEPVGEALATLPGNVHPLARAEFDRGPVADFLPMEHIIMLLKRTPEQEIALQARIDQMHNRHSPLFHLWLSPERVGACYGAADADIARISKWLQGKGFKVDSVPAGKTLLMFSGTAGQVREAFHTEIHNLDVNGRRHIANMSDPRVPATLAPVIAGFRSLHDFFPQPTVHITGLAKRDPKTGKLVLTDKSKMSPLAGAGLGKKVHPDVTYSGGDTEVGPQDFYTIYNENPLLTGTACGGSACNGSGQTIAVIEETDVCNGQTGTSPDNCNGANDLSSFRSQFGLPAASVNYLFGIASYCSDPGVQGPSGTGEEGEADIDLQWAGAVAPGATLDFVACKSTGTTAGVDLAASYAVNNLASSISSFSVSYGICEQVLPAGGFGAPSFYTALWEQAAAQGQTVVVSAGDSGDDVCDRGAKDATSGWNVNGLASTPFNVAAGGTDFSDNYSSGFGGLSGAGGPYWNSNDTSPYGSALSYIPEMTWNQECGSTLLATYISVLYATTYSPEQICNGDSPFGTDFTTVNGSGSGGSSAVNSLPTWQSVYGVSLASNFSSSTKRNLPDISLFAAAGLWNHNLQFCESDISTGTGGGTPCDYSNADDGGTMLAGGTSFVAPQLAGLMAVVNQAWPSGNPAQPTRQGQADYTLYAMANHEYGAAGAENTSTTAPSVLTCESNYLSIAQYSTVFPSCVFYNINRTPAVETSTCAGSNNSSCVVDGNVMPCKTGDTDCFTATSGDAYGLLSISTTSFEPAWYQSAGYSDAVGLGSVNIANLVSNWTSSVWIRQFASITALNTSSASIPYTSSVMLTATVTATGRGGAVAPAGVAEFFESSTSGTKLGQSPIVSSCTGTGASTSCNGTATLDQAGSSLNLGSNSIVAYFEGDGANDSPSTSTAVTVTVTGSNIPTITTLVSSLNPSQVGQAVKFTATVMGQAGGDVTPTGTVIFSNGSTELGSSPVTSGSAAITTSALPQGTDSITAVYSGDTHFASSESSPLSQVVNPGTAAVVAGSSALYLEAGQASYASQGCAWTSTASAFTLNDSRLSLADAAGAWITWQPSGSCSTPIVSSIVTYLETDSVVGARCFFASPRCTIATTVTAGVAGANALPGVSDTALPAAVLSAVSGATVNVAATDIRPEDAKFATLRALTSCGSPVATGSQYLGLGYSNGSAIQGSSAGGGGAFNVANFNLMGTDPVTGNGLPGNYAVTPVGAAPVVVLVNPEDESGFGSLLVGNIDRAVLAGYLDGTYGRTSDIVDQAYAGGSGASTVFVSEPLSGAYNTMEYAIPNSVENQSSQDVGRVAANASLARDTYPLFNCTGGVGGTNVNPLAEEDSRGSSGTSYRYRAIGAGNEIASVLATKDSLGYALWSTANFRNATPTSGKYLTVDGVDPLQQSWVDGLIPTAGNGLLGNVTMAHVKDGSYPVWSILRLVSDPKGSVGYTAATALAGQMAQFLSPGQPDFIPVAQMAVVRSHFAPPEVTFPCGTSCANLPANGDSGGAAEAGGDVGGLVYSLQADGDYNADNSTNTGNTGHRQ
jgi:hypothetical protein